MCKFFRWQIHWKGHGVSTWCLRSIGTNMPKLCRKQHKQVKSDLNSHLKLFFGSLFFAIEWNRMEFASVTGKFFFKNPKFGRQKVQESKRSIRCFFFCFMETFTKWTDFHTYFHTCQFSNWPWFPIDFVAWAHKGICLTWPLEQMSKSNCDLSPRLICTKTGCKMATNIKPSTKKLCLSKQNWYGNLWC